MARKDVDLVIRARDEATKAFNAITKALDSFTDSQAGLKKRGSETSSVLDKLGETLGGLERQLQGANFGAKIAKSLQNAEQAAERLEQSVVGARGELARFQEESARARQTTDGLRTAATATAAAIEREAAALAKAKDQIAAQSSAFERAKSDRDKLIAAEKALGQQIDAQQAKVDAAAARYAKLGAELAATAEPTKRLSAALESSGKALQTQQARLTDLQGTQGVVRAAIGQTSNAVQRLEQTLDGSNASFARQEAALARLQKEQVEFRNAIRSGVAEQKQLDAATDGAAVSLANTENALNRAQVEMTQLAAAAGKADAVLAQFASGSNAQLRQAFDAQRRAMLETRREWKQGEVAVRELAQGMVAIGPPTREQAVAWNQATTAARAAKVEYQAQREGLARLGAILRETGGDLDAIRDRQQRFVAVLGTVGAKLAQTRTDAAQSVTAFNQLAQASDRAAQGVARVARTPAAPPAAPVNALADAYRRLYGDSRQALSATQRLRGEVLSLIGSYAGLYGVINLLGQTVDAYQTLEAAQSRLGAVFDQDEQRTGQELDFIRRNADRLGISFGQLANEYTKFAASTKGTNIEGQRTRDIFIAVAEAGRVNKLSFEDMSGIFKALTQIASKGRVQLEELSGQLGDRLPGALKIMADGLGVTTAELLEMTKQGEVTSDALLGFADELRERYGPQLAASLQTTTTELGRLQNNAFQALIAFANAGFIKSFTDLLKDMNETLASADFQTFIGNLSRGVAVLVDLIGVLVENFQAVVIGLSAIAAVKIAPFITAIWAEFVKLRVAMVATAAAAPLTSGALMTMSLRAGVAAGAIGRLTLAVRALSSTTLVGAALTAVAVGFSYWATEADAAGEALARVSTTIDDVKNAYEAAGGSAKKFADEIKQMSAAKARADLRELVKGLDEIEKPRGFIIAGPNAAVLQQVNKITEGFNRGEISLESYKSQLDELADAYGQSEGFDEYVSNQVDAAEATQAQRDKIAELQAVITLIEDPTNAAAKAVLGLGAAMADSSDGVDAATKRLSGYGEAIDKLKEAIPGMAAELDKLKKLTEIDEAFQEAIKLATSIGAANEAFRLRDEARSGVEAEYSDEIVQSLGKFSDGVEAAAAILRKSEGFIARPAYDVNAQRVGYGSDTITLSDGTIQKVVKGMTVSVADANRDLLRRITTEFMPKARAQVGAGTFDALNPAQQGVLTSIAYNYGELPDRLVKAFRDGGSTQEIAAAIKALGSDNGGIRRDRYNQNAAIYGSAAGDDMALDNALDQEKEITKEKEKQAEEQAKAVEAGTAQAQQRAFELEQQGQDLINREVSKAIRERELELAKVGLTLGEAERAKITEQVTALYSKQAAEEATNATKEKAVEAEQKVNDLLTQRNELEAQQKIYQEGGETEKVAETEIAIAAVNEQLIQAIANATAMWQAVGNADAAIAKLATANLEAQKFSTAGKNTFLDWSKVGTLFADGLTNAFDQFAQAVAAGEDVGEAARRAFLQFASDFLRQIAQMIIKQAILNAMSAFGFGGGGVGVGVAHTGGLVGPGLSQRTVNPAIFAGAMRFHSGGIPGLRPNEVPTILERNEEVLTENDPRHIFNGGGATPAAGDTKIVNLFDAASFLDAALSSTVGEKAILNFVRANGAAFNGALGR
jgi:tape measure domain-containing protein